MLLGLAGVVYLTWESAAHHDWEASKKQGAIVEGADFDKESEGYQILMQMDVLVVMVLN